MDNRPLCPCHDEPMYRNGHGGHGSPQWKCATAMREREQGRYDALKGYDYNRLLLRHRRTKALARMKRRSEA